MNPVQQQDTAYVEGNFVAGFKTIYGAICGKTAAGKAAGLDTDETTNGYIGVCKDRMTESDMPGFYDEGEMMAMQVNGVCNVWLLGGKVIKSGQYLKKAGALGAGTEYLGVLGPETNPDVRTADSLVRVVGGDESGDVGSAAFAQVLAETAAGGQKTVTLAAADLTALEISAGDYVVIADANGAEVNRVAEVDATTLKMQNPLSATYTVNVGVDVTIYKLTQVKGELL